MVDAEIKSAEIVYGIVFYLYLCTHNCCFLMQYKSTNNYAIRRQVALKVINNLSLNL